MPDYDEMVSDLLQWDKVGWARLTREERGFLNDVWLGDKTALERIRISELHAEESKRVASRRHSVTVGR